MKQIPFLFLFFGVTFTLSAQSPINRRAVVQRHHIHITKADTLAALSVGNGQFAFTVDVTGLQTFPLDYQNGIPLGTFSQWGWHSFPDTANYRIEETLKPLASHGREVPYARQWPAGSRQNEAANYLRQNPHRLPLASIGWEITKKDGNKATLQDIHSINQTLDCWTGEIHSRFMVENDVVEVITLSAQTADQVAIRVKSNLLKEERLKIIIRFPAPSNQFLDNNVNFQSVDNQEIKFKSRSVTSLTFSRKLDSTNYCVHVKSSKNFSTEKVSEIMYSIQPQKSNSWEISFDFNEENTFSEKPFSQIQHENQVAFQDFWNAGGMIDFGEVADPRAKEIERRMVLSLYLTKINCGGDMPPQETGLTQNSWFGKPHLEMAWWHGVHFALWGRVEMLEKQVEWYVKNADKAGEIAERQGFEGIRWQKMTDPWGNEAPSSVGAYLIWQQPHFIYFAELLYRANPTKATLEKYGKLVEETAQFMADFAYFDPELKRFILGKGVIPAQERFKPEDTFNPTYELAYWRWALETAQNWRKRANLLPNEKWSNVLADLSPLPQKDGFYLATENAPDSYTNPIYMTDHPSVLGTFGMLPETKGLDKNVMQVTFDKVWNDWHWDDTWGWDFPMTAMTATRLHQPDRAIEALLMPIRTNTYLPNGHNFQDTRLRLYLPGNGGLLTALAMMTEGFDGENPMQGIPKNWKVKYEGLVKMP